MPRRPESVRSGVSIPEALILDLPSEVRACVTRIEDEGAQVWLVGGTVRNALLGLPSADWDLATTAGPAELDVWFPDRIDFDPRFGRLCLARAPHEIVLTSCREESGYSDHRHPDQLRFVGDPAVDALRRDFTVNAIYANPRTGTLFDPCRGIADLLVRPCLRMIGEPQQRLSEDPLRILRALRFSTSYGLPLASDLRSQLEDLGHMLLSVSAERRRTELFAMLLGPAPGAAIRMIGELGLFSNLVRGGEKIDWEMAAKRFDDRTAMGDSTEIEACEVSDGLCEFALLVAELDDPSSLELSDNLDLSRKLRQRLMAVRQLSWQLLDLTRKTPFRRDQMLRSPDLWGAVAILHGRPGTKHAVPEFLDQLSGRLKDLPALPLEPWFTGTDVIDLGIAKGPMVGEVLAAAELAWERRGALTREDAGPILREIVSRVIKDASP